MRETKLSIKITSILVIIVMIFPLSARADVANTKNIGKLAMVAILSATAFLVKKLVKQDADKTAKIREKLGKPDSHIEYQEGFDNWQIEFYGDDVYIFRNGVFLHKNSL